MRISITFADRAAPSGHGTLYEPGSIVSDGLLHGAPVIKSGLTPKISRLAYGKLGYE